MRFDFEVRDMEIYLDNAATTLVDGDVVAAMVPYLEERYGNPETPYHLGIEAQDAVEKARESVAALLHCPADRVYFTSGGTEANNWAIKGSSFQAVKQRRAVFSAVEHSSVLAPMEWMRTRAVFEDVVPIPVDGDGILRMDRFSAAVKAGVGLASVQYANNEVGTLQPVAEIATVCRENGTLFHCDACQAYGKVPIDVEELGVDMLSISAHKIHGPMGIGALYVKAGVPLEPLLHGGGQERGMRSGTLAVALIVGFGEAARLAHEFMKREMSRISRMVDELALELSVRLGATRNGSTETRLPNILNVSLPGVDASLLVGLLGKEGICISKGSACRSKATTSPVLRAMNKSRDECESAVRLSLSRNTTKEHLVFLVARMEAAAKELPKRGVM